MATESAEGIAARAFTDHHHIEMVFWLYRQHVPAVFHASQLRHPSLFVQHLVVIHHHVFDKTKGRITGVNHLEYTAPGKVLHRLEKEDPDAEQQAQRIHFPQRDGSTILRRTAMTPRAKMKTASR